MLKGQLAWRSSHSKKLDLPRTRKNRQQGPEDSPQEISAKWRCSPARRRQHRAVQTEGRIKRKKKTSKQNSRKIIRFSPGVRVFVGQSFLAILKSTPIRGCCATQLRQGFHIVKHNRPPFFLAWERLPFPSPLSLG